MSWWPWTRIRELEIHSMALESANTVQQSIIDQLRLDNEHLRQDFNQVVGMLGGMATRPVSKTLFDDNPFDEVEGEDEYMSPDSKEAVNVKAVESALDA